MFGPDSIGAGIDDGGRPGAVPKPSFGLACMRLICGIQELLLQYRLIAHFQLGFGGSGPKWIPSSLCIEADSSERAEILYGPRLLGC
jgi:hypothetical protein